MPCIARHSHTHTCSNLFDIDCFWEIFILNMDPFAVCVIRIRAIDLTYAHFQRLSMSSSLSTFRCRRWWCRCLCRLVFLCAVESVLLFFSLFALLARHSLSRFFGIFQFHSIYLIWQCLCSLLSLSFAENIISIYTKNTVIMCAIAICSRFFGPYTHPLYALLPLSVFCFHLYSCDPFSICFSRFVYECCW